MTKPEPYQYEGARQIQVWKGRALLADDMGLGKTFQALYWASRNPHKRPIVVVCPASMKYVWQHEALHHIGMPSYVCDGTKPPRIETLRGHEMFIVNYNILQEWLPLLVRLHAQVVFLDEVHNIKNRLGRKFKATKALCKGVPCVVAISGTPILNRPAELWPTLHLLDPRRWPSFISYGIRYCKPKRTPYGWKYEGAERMPELHKILKETCMIRRLKKDVLPHLGTKERIIVPVDLARHDEYREASENFLGWLHTISPSRAKKAGKNEAMARINYLLRLCHRLKHNYVRNWIDNFLEESNGKLVVFTKSTKVIEKLKERYGNICVMVDGSVANKKRKFAVDSFQRDPNIRLFLGNYEAAGVGLTLTAAQDWLAADLPWTPAALNQSEDRIHRIGQKFATRFHYLVARGTVEDHLCTLLRTKQGVLSSLMDGEDTTNEYDILSELMDKLNRKKTR